MRKFVLLIAICICAYFDATCQIGIDTISDANMAAAYFKNNNYAASDSCILSAIKQRKTYDRLILRGDINFASNKLDIAIDCYREACKITSDIGLLKLSQMYAKKGMLDSAFWFLEKYSALYNRVVAFKIENDTLLNNLKDDIRWFNFIKKLSDKPLVTDLNSAAYFIKRNKQEYAFDLLNQIIKKYPSNSQAYYLRSLAYLNDSNTRSALPDIEKALDLKSKTSCYHKTKADILFASKKFKLAALSYISAIVYDEFAVENFYNAALSFYNAEDYENAAKYARLAQYLFPLNQEILLLEAKALVKTDNCIDALKVLSKMSNTQDKYADYLYVRGLAYLQGENYENAINDFSLSLDLDSSLKEIYLQRGLAYYKNGEKDLAHADWNKALKYRIYKANDYLKKYR